VFDLCAGGLWEKEGADEGSGGRGERALPRSRLTLLPFLFPSPFPAACIVQDLTPIYVRLPMHAREDPRLGILFHSNVAAISRSPLLPPLSLSLSPFLSIFRKLRETARSLPTDKGHLVRSILAP